MQSRFMACSGVFGPRPLQTEMDHHLFRIGYLYLVKRFGAPCQLPARQVRHAVIWKLTARERTGLYLFDSPDRNNGP